MPPPVHQNLDIAIHSQNTHSKLIFLRSILITCPKEMSFKLKKISVTDEYKNSQQLQNRMNTFISLNFFS